MGVFRRKKYPLWAMKSKNLAQKRQYFAQNGQNIVEMGDFLAIGGRQIALRIAQNP